MAPRKKPHTDPVLDNSFEKECPSDNDTKIVHALPRDHFLSVIRNVKKMPTDSLRPIVHLTFHALRKLGVPRDLSEALPGIPEGSDHFDFQSFKIWVEKIVPTDLESVGQLVAIDATAKTREVA